MIIFTVFQEITWIFWIGKENFLPFWHKDGQIHLFGSEQSKKPNLEGLISLILIALENKINPREELNY